MKRQFPLSFPAILAAALLPGTALVGCKSTDTTDTATGSPGEAGSSTGEIVRPASVPAVEKPDQGATKDPDKSAEVAATPAADVEEKAPEGFRLFRKKDRGKEADANPPVVAEAADDGAEKESEPVAEESKPKRKPLFGRKKDKDAADDAAPEGIADAEIVSEPEVAAVKEKKKFRLFGLGKRKEKDAEPTEVPADDTIIAVNGERLKPAEKEAPAVDRGTRSLPWDDSDPEIAGHLPDDPSDPDAFAGVPATGVTARIRPGDTSGGVPPVPPVSPAFPEESPLDSVPSLNADPPIIRPRDDGFVPLSPEPKFPGEEEILPPGN